MNQAPNHAFGAEYSVPGLHAGVSAALDHLPRDTPILDLGCGSGALLRRLKHAGFTDLTGVDWSLPARTEDGITFFQADLSQPSVSLGRKFGLIMVVEVVEHMPNLGLMLQGVRNHLDSSGQVFISTPNICSLNQRIKFLVTGRLTHFDEAGDPTHYLPVLPDAWGKMLKLYRLEEVRRWSYPTSNFVNGVTPLWSGMAGLLSLVLPNSLPGENLFLLLRVTEAQEGAWEQARKVHT